MGMAAQSTRAPRALLAHLAIAAIAIQLVGCTVLQLEDGSYAAIRGSDRAFSAPGLMEHFSVSIWFRYTNLTNLDTVIVSKRPEQFQVLCIVRTFLRQLPCFSSVAVVHPICLLRARPKFPFHLSTFPLFSSPWYRYPVAYHLSSASAAG